MKIELSDRLPSSGTRKSRNRWQVFYKHRCKRASSRCAAGQPSSAALSYHCRARAMSGLMPIMPIRSAIIGSNVLPRAKAASAFPAVAARRNSSRAETKSPFWKKFLPNLSSIIISSFVICAASEVAIVANAGRRVTVDVRESDVGSEVVGLPAASAGSGLEFGVPRSAALGAGMNES